MRYLKAHGLSEWSTWLPIRFIINNNFFQLLYNKKTISLSETSSTKLSSVNAFHYCRQKKSVTDDSLFNDWPCWYNMPLLFPQWLEKLRCCCDLQDQIRPLVSTFEEDTYNFGWTVGPVNIFPLWHGYNPTDGLIN